MRSATHAARDEHSAYVARAACARCMSPVLLTRVLAACARCLPPGVDAAASARRVGVTSSVTVRPFRPCCPFRPCSCCPFRPC
eukprot:210858-Chlamydomonas_euryale.AAC.1